MISSDDNSPPLTMTVLTRGPRMKPTPNSAAETSVPSWPLRRNGMRTSISSGTSRSPPTIVLKSPPAMMPSNTPRARPPPWLATSTSAQAVPSGYGSVSCSRSMRNLRSGIMNSVPSTPPASARRVICSSDGSMPQRNSAGKVKITPLATELDAEPMVWDMFASRMLPRTAIR